MVVKNKQRCKQMLIALCSLGTIKASMYFSCCKITLSQKVCNSIQPNYADSDGLFEVRSNNNVRMASLNWYCFVQPRENLQHIENQFHINIYLSPWQSVWLFVKMRKLTMFKDKNNLMFNQEFIKASKCFTSTPCTATGKYNGINSYLKHQTCTCNRVV